jgi:hypothetical protein
MTEWQIIDSDDFEELPPETSPPAWRRSGWELLAVGVILILVLVGLRSLWQQRVAGRAVLAEDLNAVIFAEETNRALGRVEAALYQPDAPNAWQHAYLRSFDSPAELASENSTASVASIDDFDGQCAVVTLAGARYDPVRAYCLAEVGWRRTPIPPAAWGEESELVPVNGLRLRFRQRDRAFAESLAAELAELSDELPLAGLEIVVEPHDLAGPLILVKRDRIVLNSPALLPVQPDSSGWLRTLSGAEAVRLALGQRLVNRTPLVSPPRLPSAARFIAAVQTVTAMRLLLDPGAQARLRENWRADLTGDWVSPFFTEMLPQTNRFSARQAEAAALLTADYLAQRHGPEALAHVLARIPRAPTWNEVFGDLPLDSAQPAAASLSFSPPVESRGASQQHYVALRLEIEVAHYAGAGQNVLASLYQTYSRPLEPPPLLTKLRYLDQRSEDSAARYAGPQVFINPAGILFNWPLEDERLQGWRLYVSRPGQNEPLLVEVPPDLALITPDGLPLSPGCLGPGADLAIEGKWLEAPRRFQASRITVQRAPRVSPRPAESLAYLLLQADPETASAAQLVTLRPDGSFRALLDLSPRLQLFPLPTAPDEPFRLLIRSDAPTCSRSWFGLYEPGRGVIAHWFAPEGAVEWVWRPDLAEPVFITSSDSSRTYHFYRAGQATAEPWQNSTPYGFSFLGWQPAGQRLVTIGYRIEDIMLGLLDPASGQLAWRANPPAYTVKAHGLSPAGDWLAYPTGLPSLFGPSGRFYLLNLTEHSRPIRLQLDPGQGLAALAWSPYLDQSSLALLTGPIVDTAIRPTQLFRLDPARPQKLVPVAQAGEGEQFSPPVFCRNGDLLYATEQAGQYELRRQSPGEAAEMILSVERPIRPLACGR